MKSCDIEYFYFLHQELWNWLAKNPDKPKYTWPGFAAFFRPFGDCFACEFLRFHGTCCMLNWPTTYPITRDRCIPKKLYMNYVNHQMHLRYVPSDKDTRKKVTQLALKIRDLPLSDPAIKILLKG